jgi:type IV secretory pathway component VirB8
MFHFEFVQTKTVLWRKPELSAVLSCLTNKRVKIGSEIISVSHENVGRIRIDRNEPTQGQDKQHQEEIIIIQFQFLVD